VTNDQVSRKSHSSPSIQRSADSFPFRPGATEAVLRGKVAGWRFQNELPGDRVRWPVCHVGEAAGRLAPAEPSTAPSEPRCNPSRASTAPAAGATEALGVITWPLGSRVVAPGLVGGRIARADPYCRPGRLLPGIQASQVRAWAPAGPGGPCDPGLPGGPGGPVPVRPTGPIRCGNLSTRRPPTPTRRMGLPIATHLP
jgi:hypothetical protein